MILRFTAALALAAFLGACAPQQPPSMIASSKSALELRTMQSRTFETEDRNRMMRAIIATLMDLGYRVEKAESAAGTVSAEKLNALSISASVYPRGDSQTVVRANAVVKVPGAIPTQVDEPEFYQKMFFAPLSQAVFLDAAATAGEILPVEAEEAPAVIIPGTPASVPASAPAPENGAKTEE